ncbi:hypothetical protein KAU33_09110 [Candidatus Dependentiae bacterium]|nr:hypothetical protein [Candidatus Dependentiae bacterium]
MIMEENVNIDSIVKEIKNLKNSITDNNTFIEKVSNILLEVGIEEYFNTYQILDLSGIPPNQKKLILEKLRNLIEIKNPGEKDVKILIDKLKKKLDISPSEYNEIVDFVNNEFYMGRLSEYLERHNEINRESFIMGFIACSRCVD